LKYESDKDAEKQQRCKGSKLDPQFKGWRHGNFLTERSSAGTAGAGVSVETG
jgi:hypothetical protein